MTLRILHNSGWKQLVVVTSSPKWFQAKESHERYSELLVLIRKEDYHDLLIWWFFDMFICIWWRWCLYEVRWPSNSRWRYCCLSWRQRGESGKSFSKKEQNEEENQNGVNTKREQKTNWNQNIARTLKAVSCRQNSVWTRILVVHGVFPYSGP